MSGMWEGLTAEQQENLYVNSSMDARGLLRDILPYEQKTVLDRINKKDREASENSENTELIKRMILNSNY